MKIELTKETSIHFDTDRYYVKVDGTYVDSSDTREGGEILFDQEVKKRQKRKVFELLKSVEL